MKKWGPVVVLAAVAAVGLSIAVAKVVLGPGGEAGASSGAAPAKRVSAKGTAETAGDWQGVGMTALSEAAEAKQYLFAFFWKDDSEATAAMRKVLEEAMRKASDRARSVSVDASDPAERPIVDKFGLDRAPLPLVLAIAPNGAVMGGFPKQATEEQLLDAFGTPCTERCMKAVQESKLVLLCIQNAKTKSNEAAMKGVNDFKADERFGHATTVITLDPTDKKEAAFLADLQVAPEITEATTVFLVPPGRPVAKYEGATEKQTLVDTLGKANTGCGPGGCGPGGCCPAK